MAEYNLTKEIGPINSITGNTNRSKYLYYQLKDDFKSAESIDFIVSFLMESGVKMILPDLREAINRGVRVRILTGKYLGITQPTALYLLKSEFGDKIDLRFYYTSTEQSFHPKAYFFHKKNGSDVFVGSSNISRSALTSGIEWNYRLNSNQNQTDFNDFYNTFENLFNHHSVIIDDEQLKAYAKSWHRPAVAKDLDKFESFAEDDTLVFKNCEPRGAHIEALYALEQSRKEGADRGLVQAATGVGKTYLAAFDSKNYKHVLFVAHREEILNQAAASFCNVRCSNDYGFFNGTVHDTNKAVIFASVASLGKDEYLNGNYFNLDYFDYIVVDEFHHAVNNQYKKIIDYFKPKFLLGLTATPERTDGRSIYELCDYNVPYEINLYQAINRGMLVPFHYYGIYDQTDYSGLKFVKGDYLESELNVTYLNNAIRDNLIYKHYLKYHSKRALGFCCSRVHAEYMAKVFTQRKIPAVAVYSNSDGEYSENRAQAIKMLEEGKIKVIFSVDMFNEGVDIPEVDTVMFLRPTQSGIVFLQQLGRGLRTSKGKEYLNVLDFIGNYKFAGKNISLLSEQKRPGSLNSLNTEVQYPDGCLVDFDMELIDLFEEMNKRKLSIHETIQNEFLRIKDLLDDKVPTRMELFTHMDSEIYSLCLSNAKENPFK
ncbi:MAG: DEAD/DEAH box helicase family protein, partial [Treponema sp.]|nr:DEAD/DEAH box helicase family protein [Treponema sp.]